MTDKSDPKPNTDITYVALAANHWGKGFTIDSAKHACRRAGDKAVVVKKLPEGAYNVHVDGMGMICWNQMEEPVNGEWERCTIAWESREYKRRKKSA